MQIGQIVGFLIMFGLWFVVGAVFTALVIHFLPSPDGNYQERECAKQAHKKVVIGFGIAVGLIGTMVWISRLPSN